MKKIFLVTSTSMLLLSFFAQAGMYRWVDDKGEVHFSDKVPVAASREVVSEINKSGEVENTVDPEADARARAELENSSVEREKIEHANKAIDKKLASIKKHDNFLLSTYNNKDELTAVFNKKIKLMKGQSSILDAQFKILEDKLNVINKKKKRASNTKKHEALDARIVDLNMTIERYKRALIQNKEDITVLTQNYKKDIERYTELTK